MVAVLALALCSGAIVASLAAGTPGGFFVVATVVSLVAALAIAALLVLPVVAVRRTRPANGIIAAALIAGGLVTFPVSTNFYEDASLAAEGGGVGYCGGVLPLSQVVHNGVADEPYARLYYFAGCDD